MSEAVTAPSGSKCGRCGASLAAGAQRCDSCGMAVLAVAPASGSAPAAGPTDLGIGETLMGQWKLESKLGQGGMGNVFLATELKLGRKVAVKALSVNNLQDETVKRFEREAQVMGKLDHPNIVTLYAVGRHREIPFLVMRYLGGGSLWDLLDANGGRLLPEQLVPLVKQLCAALGYIHGKNLIHRDLKPSNIFISPTGKVTVLDLGLARGHSTTLTRTGIIWGTPDFMAPEQIVGEKQLDGRADLYALGVVLYRMISTEPPFPEQDEQALMRAHLTRPRPDIRKVWSGATPALSLMLQKAMAIKPEERFQTADELAAAFERAALAREQPTRASSPAAVITAAPVQKPVSEEENTAIGTQPAIAGPHAEGGDELGEDERTLAVDGDERIAALRAASAGKGEGKAPEAAGAFDGDDDRTVALGAKPPEPTANASAFDGDDDRTVALSEKPSEAAHGPGAFEGEDDRTAAGFMPAPVEPTGGDISALSLTPQEPGRVPLGSRSGGTSATLMDRPAARPVVPTEPAAPSVARLDDSGGALPAIPDPPVLKPVAPAPELLDGVAPKSSGGIPRSSVSTKQRREPTPRPKSKVKRVPEAETPAWLHPYVLVVGGLLLLALGFLIGVLLR